MKQRVSFANISASNSFSSRRGIVAASLRQPHTPASTRPTFMLRPQARRSVLQRCLLSMLRTARCTRSTTSTPVRQNTGLSWTCAMPNVSSGASARVAACRRCSSSSAASLCGTSRCGCPSRCSICVTSATPRCSRMPASSSSRRRAPTTRAGTAAGTWPRRSTTATARAPLVYAAIATAPRSACPTERSCSLLSGLKYPRCRWLQASGHGVRQEQMYPLVREMSYGVLTGSCSPGRRLLVTIM